MSTMGVSSSLVSTTNGITFKVDDVKPGNIEEEKMYYQTTKQVSERFCQNSEGFTEKLEACGLKNSSNDADSKESENWLRKSSHGLFFAMFFAYASHFPLILSPDHIYQTVLEGWNVHVAKNAEALRKKFVNHEGKKTLKVRRDDFVKGNPNNPWPEVFQSFCDQIKSNTNNNLYEIVTNPFSTTGPVETIARNVSLMSATKHYFDFKFSTCCGFPSITLQGKKDDWVVLKQMVNNLRTFMMEDFANNWLKVLNEIIDKFIETYDGKVDKLFWSSMVKYYSTHGSGGDTYITGWVNGLFPFLDEELNGLCMPWSKLQNHIKDNGGPHKTTGSAISDFEYNFCQAPVEWDYLGTKFDLVFKTGFVGAVQDSNGAITPKLSWAILEKVKREPGSRDFPF